MKKKVFSFLVLGVILGLACDSFAIMIWWRMPEWSETGDMIIYNDTDAKVSVTGSDGWNHQGLLDSGKNNSNLPIGPYSLRLDPNMNIYSDSDNKGYLLVSIQSQDGSKAVDDFKIEAKTAHSYTYYELHTDDDESTHKWTFTSGEEAVPPGSGAHAIPDDNGYVAQMFNDLYVVSFFANNEADSSSDDTKWTGNSKMILFISKNDEGSFSDDSVDNYQPGTWVPYDP